MPKDVKHVQAEYIKTIHAGMLTAQKAYRHPTNCLKNQPEVTSEDRRILINWLLIVQVEFRLLPETIQTTVSLIDQYLSINSVKIDTF